MHQKVAVVGPNVLSENVMLGNYFGLPTDTWSVMEGLRKKLGSDVEIIYEPGCSYVDNRVFRSAWDADCFSYKGTRGIRAEYFTNPSFKGKPQLTKMEQRISFQHGDGEYIADGIAANQMSIRYSADYTSRQDGQISFSLSGDDGYRLYIDGELCIDSQKGDPYYTFDVKRGKTIR